MQSSYPKKDEDKLQHKVPLTIKMSSQVHMSPFYRLMLLYVEPFMAFHGATMAARTPLLYLSVMVPDADPALFYRPEMQVVLDQLAGTYLLFAFNQAVVLRAADGHLRVWRALLAGMLLCDLVHVAATARAMGGWAVMVDPAVWRPYDWVNIVILYGVAAMRVAFLCGVGVRESASPVAGGQAPEMQARSKAKTG